MESTFPTRGLLSAIVCFTLVLLPTACSDEPETPPAVGTASPGSGKPDGTSAAHGDLHICPPMRHENMTVFMITGPDRLEVDEILTLSEALEQDKLIVHETGNVNELSVENTCDTPVFIAAGDIVRGGKQDRMLQHDYIVRAHSGKVPVSSFCVEQGRWSARAGSSLGEFDSSKNQVFTSALKVASRGYADQGWVWTEVRESQDRLSRALDKNVQAGESATSLELSLSDRDLNKTAEAYVGALSGAPEAVDSNVIGVAFAVNGEVTNVDVYASAALFRKLWPKLLRTGAIEAIAAGKPTSDKSAEAADVREMLARADRTEKALESVNDQLRVRKAVEEDVAYFESLYQAAGNRPPAPVRVNVLKNDRSRNNEGPPPRQSLPALEGSNAPANEAHDSADEAEGSDPPTNKPGE